MTKRTDLKQYLESTKTTVSVAILCLIFGNAAVLARENMEAAQQAAAVSLMDPGFSSMKEGARSVWTRSQHAGERSYTYTASDRVLTIERIASEPWGKVSQRLDATALRGKVLEFTAEVRSTFRSSEDPIEAVTGIGIQIKGFRAGLPRALGAAILSTEYAKPEISTSHTDWTLQTVRFEVPENATIVHLNILLGRWGTLEVRDPTLRDTFTIPD